MDEVNAKLDRIIGLLEEKKRPTDEAKKEIIEFMMSKFNILWLDDAVEENAYKVILDFIFDKLL